MVPFNSFGGRRIEVDVVDPANPRMPHTPPGVDADVDNLQVGPGGRLGLKVPAAAGGRRGGPSGGDGGGGLLPLFKCVAHAERGKFVFFYRLDAPAGVDSAVVRRLEKLLGKGFVCVSPVPPAVLDQLSPKLRAQVRPKPKYDRHWWVADV